MSNYFRITAYHKEKDFSIIIDSNGLYDKIWQFSSFLVSKGFSIKEVSDSDTFTSVTIQDAAAITNKLILQACDIGQPISTIIEHLGIEYTAIQVADMLYVLQK